MGRTKKKPKMKKKQKMKKNATTHKKKKYSKLGKIVTCFKKVLYFSFQTKTNKNIVFLVHVRFTTIYNRIQDPSITKH